MSLPILSPVAQFQHDCHRLITALLVLVSLPVGLAPGVFAQEPADQQTDASVFFEENVLPIFEQHCLDCHGPDTQESGLRLDRLRSLLRGGDSGEPSVVPGNPDQSYLLQVLSGNDPDVVMPPDDELLSEEDQQVLRRWIENGAEMPGSATDEASEGTDHWSFQPILKPTPPSVADAPSSNAIDAFVLARLKASDLEFSPRADRQTLIRRLYFVMHGLPPRPDEVEAFVNDPSPDAWPNLVDRVLESPRYGERWARHWLDLIRFGETHGFETNRERPQAWHYRDWVIQALNDDKPYNDFIREQLAGDALGEPIGTGFLVAGPHDLVKSPDINLTLMQRQDELADLINATGTSFLGLTLGCARCHNHKFDPITQRDFYSIQAIFAGVQHGERALPLSTAEQLRLAEIQHEIEQLRQNLQPFLPRASRQEFVLLDDGATPGSEGQSLDQLAQPSGKGKNPEGVQPGFKSDPGSTHRMPNISGGAYTWWENQADQDVIAYQPGVAGTYRIWVSWGAGYTTHTRDARYLLDLDGDLSTRNDQTEIASVDQQQLAEHQQDEAKTSPPNQPLWSGLMNVGEFLLNGKERVVLRGGSTGSAITADLVVFEPVVPSAPRHRTLRPRLRPPVSATGNVERIEPVEAKYIRFTIDDTNASQPCLDELEILSNGVNVALAELGSIATCSSTLPGYDIHRLEHINDGRYGNSNSWISNEPASGWIQIELAEPTRIDQIQWARDREGRFADRVATRYRIEVSLDGEVWQLACSSSDRMPFGTDATQVPLYRFDQADEVEARRGRESLARLDELLAEQSQLQQTPVVYAGTFTEPPPTHRLYRGDPMAKREEVMPDAISVLTTLGLDATTPEQQRRLRFADWVASPDNPLTARVIVNRLWQFHFGNGIVSTSNDFGGNGVPPSHPELLDWLAAEFLEQGWSLKEMHRQILLSQTWQQDSRPVPAALRIDAGARLLWRFPPRRLEAEAIRDSMLAASGVLDLTMGGPGFSGFEVELENVRHFFPKSHYGPEDYRRMVYMTVVRQERESVFGVFDCPDASQVVARRSRSTTPLQALNLLNSNFTLQQAELLTERIREDSLDDTARQVARAYQLCYGRAASPEEIEAAVEFVSVQGLEQFCRAIFNSNEFLFIP